MRTTRRRTKDPEPLKVTVTYCADADPDPAAIEQLLINILRPAQGFEAPRQEAVASRRTSPAKVGG